LFSWLYCSQYSRNRMRVGFMPRRSTILLPSTSTSSKKSRSFIQFSSSSLDSELTLAEALSSGSSCTANYNLPACFFFSYSLMCFLSSSRFLIVSAFSSSSNSTSEYSSPMDSSSTYSGIASFNFPPNLVLSSALTGFLVASGTFRLLPPSEVALLGSVLLYLEAADEDPEGAQAFPLPL